MLQFGGHHLALNITISGATDVMTPSLTGAQPALFIMNDAAAAKRLAQLQSELNDTWSGPLDFEPGTNITAYYRIQGPHVVIEHAPGPAQ